MVIQTTEVPPVVPCTTDPGYRSRPNRHAVRIRKSEVQGLGRTRI